MMQLIQSVSFKNPRNEIIHQTVVIIKLMNVKTSYFPPHSWLWRGKTIWQNIRIAKMKWPKCSCQCPQQSSFFRFSISVAVLCQSSGTASIEAMLALVTVHVTISRNILVSHLNYLVDSISKIELEILSKRKKSTNTEYLSSNKQYCIFPLIRWERWARFGNQRRPSATNGGQPAANGGQPAANGGQRRRAEAATSGDRLPISSRSKITICKNLQIWQPRANSVVAWPPFSPISRHLFSGFSSFLFSLWPTGNIF